MRRALLALLLMFACPTACLAGLTERQLQDVKLDPAPGTLLPLATTFTSAESGAAVTLGTALAGKPAVLVLLDYTCRFICGSTLAIAAAALSGTGLTPEADFQLAVIGLDPRDGRDAALALKAEKLGPYPALASKAAFLVGDAAAIGRVTGALNYRAVYDREIDQFAHPTAAIVLTPQGRVSRVISGLALDGTNLRLALKDARDGQVLGIASGIRLLCYSLDPMHGPYTFAIRLVLMAAGILTLAAIAAFAGLLTRRAKGARPS
jgi:protein SCO1/2